MTATQFTRADIVADCVLDISDYAALLSYFGQSGGQGVQTSYVWDAENRLIRVEPAGTPVSGNQKVEFAYDYLGRRIEKKVYTHNGSSWGSATTTRFVYYNWLCLLEYTVGGGGSLSLAKKFTWGLDLAGLNGSTNSMEQAGGIGGLLSIRDAKRCQSEAARSRTKISGSFGSSRHYRRLFAPPTIKRDNESNLRERLRSLWNTAYCVSATRRLNNLVDDRVRSC